MKHELSKLVSQVQELATQAGSLIMDHYKKAISYTYKPDGSFATQADLASEKFLVAELKKLIPGASFYAEESGVTAGNDYCWVIDPLDGTTNFSRSLPYFCVSIALTYKDTRLLGVIFNPITQELFWATQGEGAFLNRTRLQISGCKELQKATIGFALPYNKHNSLCKIICAIEPQVYTSRIMGAAALDIAYCAAGRFEVALFEKLSWWDMAAGALLVEEAGGITFDTELKPLTSGSTSFIGGTPELVDKLKQTLCSC